MRLSHGLWQGGSWPGALCEPPGASGRRPPAVSCVLKDRAGPWALGSRGTEGELKAPTGRSLDAWTLSSVDLSGLLKP